MSHFVIIGLFDKTTPDIEAAVAKAMEPYSENLEVDEYQHECHCGEYLAQADARKQTARNASKLPRIVKEWETLEAKIYSELSKDIRPVIDCEECKGTGFYPSTYNPKSKWDWYVIGGRWTGFLDPTYDPEKDPDNIETCQLCRGTGIRPDMPIFEEGAMPLESEPIGYEAAKCNGCEGKGTRVKWDLKEFSGDIVSATKWLELLNEDVKKFTPFAVVTPDGEWHERGKMGWFAIVQDETDKDEWAAKVKALAEQHADNCIAVVIDCHI